MVFEIRTPELDHVEPLFRAAADMYLSMLHHRFFFQAKLDVLTVIIDDDHSQPSFFTLGDNQNTAIIELHLYPEDDPWMHLIPATHELAHLLMSTMGLSRCVTLHDKSSYFVSNVHRLTEDGNSVGLGLEEAIADDLAIEVTRRVAKQLNMPMRKVNTYLRQYELEHRHYLIHSVRALATIFGQPLKKLSALDECTEIGLQVVFTNPNDDNAQLSPSGTRLNSLFWTHLVTQSFAEISYTIDRHLGSGAYLDMCRLFDAIYYVQADRVSFSSEEQLLRALLGERSTVENESYQKLTEIIARLKASMRNCRGDYNQRTCANASLRVVISHMRRRIDAFIRDLPEERAKEYVGLLTLRKQLNLGSPMKSLAAASITWDAFKAEMQPPYLTLIIHIAAMTEMFDCARQVIRRYAPELLPGEE